MGLQLDAGEYMAVPGWEKQDSGLTVLQVSLNDGWHGTDSMGAPTGWLDSEGRNSAGDHRAEGRFSEDEGGRRGSDVCNEVSPLLDMGSAVLP